MQLILVFTVTLLAECLSVFALYKNADNSEKSYKHDKYKVKNRYEENDDNAYEAYDKSKRSKSYGEFEGKQAYGYKHHQKSEIICVPLATASSYKLSQNEECAPYTLNINETFESISNHNTTLFLGLIEYNPDVDFEEATNGTTICVPSLKYKYKLSGPCLSYIMQKGDKFKSLSNRNQALLINLTNANPSGFEVFITHEKHYKEDKDYLGYKRNYKNDEMKSNHEDKYMRYKKSFICVPLETASKYKLRKTEDCAPYMLNINETLVSISNNDLTLFLELIELNPGVNYMTSTNGTIICVSSLKYNYKLSGPCLAYHLEKGETLKSLSNGDLSLYIGLKNSNPNGYGYSYRKKHIKEVDIKETKPSMPYE